MNFEFVRIRSMRDLVSHDSCSGTERGILLLV